MSGVQEYSLSIWSLCLAYLRISFAYPDCLSPASSYDVVTGRKGQLRFDSGFVLSHTGIGANHYTVSIVIPKARYENGKNDNVGYQRTYTNYSTAYSVQHSRKPKKELHVSRSCHIHSAERQMYPFHSGLTFAFLVCPGTRFHSQTILQHLQALCHV